MVDGPTAGDLFVADVERLGTGRYGQRTWISRRLLLRAASRQEARAHVAEKAPDWRLVRLKRANAEERRIAAEREI